MAQSASALAHGPSMTTSIDDDGADETMSDTIERDDETIEEVIERFDALLEEGDLDEAQTLIDDAIVAHPDAPMLYASKAELAIEREDFDEGISILDEALEALGDEEGDDEARATLLSHKAYASFYTDQFDQARHLFNKALRHDPEMWSGLVGRATVHERLGFLVASLIDLEHAIDIHDQDAAPFSLRAKVFLRRNQIDEAKRDFEYALESDPFDEEARLSLARIEASRGATGYAIELLEPLIEHGEQPDLRAVGALLRSQLSMTLGSTATASEDAHIAIEAWPERPWGYLQLAACQLASGQPEETLKSLKQAEAQVANVRDVPDISALRASAYEQMERKDQAAREHQKVEGSPRLPAIVYGAILNPAQNMPINPNRPVDIRAILGNLFGNPDRAPKGYEEELRKIIDRIPKIVEENPNVERIQIELPEVEGMRTQARNLVIQVNPNRASSQGAQG